MGLDITAYCKLTPAPDAAMEDGCVVEWEKYAQFHPSTLDWTEQNWPGHSGGIAPGVYSFGDKLGFRAGSYGGYNAWRDQLSRFALGMPAAQVWESEAKGAFSELIHFADNEGVIGPAVAAKLAKDFADYQDRAVEYAQKIGDDWWLQNYGHWRKAFELAADAGAVDFH